MSNPERNKATILNFYEETLKNNLSVYDALFAPAFVNHGVPPIPDMHGPEEFKQAFVMYRHAFPDFDTPIEIVMADGDYVMVYGTATGTHQGDFLGLPPTGRQLKWTAAAIYRFNEAGLIVERWSEQDSLGFMAQLGLIPGMGTVLAGSDTPGTGEVMRRPVNFRSERQILKGWLYLPGSLTLGQKAPAIVMANAVTAIKEITLPGYAQRFAETGFVVLVFDYAHWGESEGEPRNHFVAYTQQQNLRDAITWLASQPEVDAARIGGWGVSMGGAHLLYLSAFDRRLKAVAVTAASVNAVPIWEGMMGREGLQRLMAQIGQEREQRFSSGLSAIHLQAWGKPGEMCAIPQEEAYDFYSEAQRTVAPTYENRITLQSVQNMIEYNPDYAVHLASPTAILIVHATHDLIPVDMVRGVYSRIQEPKKLVVLDCMHTDLYTREPWVTQSAQEAIAWFQSHLSLS